LLNFDDKPDRHMMWNKIKLYIIEHDIDLDSTSFELKDLLENLHDLTNKAAHGDIAFRYMWKIQRR
jgi:hypothetical protein